MKNLRMFAFFVAFLMSLNFCFCTSKNEKKIQSMLVERKSEYFSKSDKFSKIGQIAGNKGENIDIYFNEHKWGNGRLSCRIVIFIDNELIGSYGVINDCPKVVNGKLIFPYDDDLGNVICLNGNIPQEVYLDGESFYFERF